MRNPAKGLGVSSPTCKGVVSWNRWTDLEERFHEPAESRECFLWQPDIGLHFIVYVSGFKTLFIVRDGTLSGNSICIKDVLTDFFLGDTRVPAMVGPAGWVGSEELSLGGEGEEFLGLFRFADVSE